MRFRMAIKLVFLAAALVCGLSAARAQDYPQRTIRLVVGYGAGGGTDLVARIIGQALQEKLGQPVIIENKVGASGMLGADSVAKATPDGYTLYLVNNAHVIVGVMHKSVPYNTLSSFQAVGQVATGNLLVVAHPSFPAKNIGELIALAKKDPGKFTYASVGTRHHAAFHRRIVQPDRRRANAPCAVPQLARGDSRRPRKAGRPSVRHGVGGAGAGSVGRSSRPGALGTRAFQRLAKRADWHRVPASCRISK